MIAYVRATEGPLPDAWGRRALRVAPDSG